MAVKPTSDQLKQLIDALLSAFNYDELKQLVSFELDEELAWFTPVTGKRDLRTVVTELVLFYASQDGGLRRLLTAACKMNDGNELLEQVERDWDGIDFEPLSLPDDHPHQTIIHGDQIEGDKIGNDKVGRDKTTTGDIADSVFAVGEGAQANITHNYYGTDKPEPADPAPGDPPYLGLNYFTADDAHLFFGRDALTSELVAQLNTYNQSETRFLAVIGASGSGKSSLVRAGLVPALRSGAIDGSDRWVVHVVTPTARPLESLAISLTQESESVTAADTLMADMVQTVNSLHLYVRRLMTGTSAETRLLLVVDQFEELFTLCKDPKMQQHFVDNLMSAAMTDGPTVVVLTLRADFYAQCARFDDLRSVIKRQQEYIGAMSEEELRQAIVEPATTNGWDFQDGLVDLILKDVGNEPGALPLLSHALHETWKRRRGQTLTHDGYQAVGGVNGAIAKTADHIYNELSADQQAIARTIFIRLTELGEGSEDTRRRVALAELQPTDGNMGRVDEVLKALADARLVTTHETEAEVAHEALIREWDTLRGWLDDDRDDLRTHRRLTEEATEWGKNHDGGLLYRGGRLEQALLWTESHAGQINEQEDAFLAASQAERQRELDAEERIELERREAQQRELENAQALAAAAEEQRETEAARASEAEKRQKIEEERAVEAEQASSRLRRRALSLGAALAIALIGIIATTYFYFESSNNEEKAQQNLIEAERNADEAERNADEAERNAQVAAARLNQFGEVVGGLGLDSLLTIADDLVTSSDRNGAQVLLETAIRANPNLLVDVSIDELSNTSRSLLFTAIQNATDDPTQFSDESIIQALTDATEILGVKDKNGAAYIHIPAGEFLMGSDPSDNLADSDERPQHMVKFEEYWIQQTEVTKAQYLSCMKNGPCTEPSDSRINDVAFFDHPVVGVDWYQASAYAEWVGGRLPTEAEWEYACRGSDNRLYPWGNDQPNEERLNYSGTIGDTTAVGSYPVGANGLYDMAGNVWEWTSTQYQNYPYDADDGREDQSDDGSRTLRGRSFWNDDDGVRCANRGRSGPYNDLVNFGFRIVVVESPGFLPSETSAP